MTDVFTKAKRSAVMSRIRSHGNADTELALARLLRAHGITGWRRQLQVRMAGSNQENDTSPQPSPRSRRRGRGTRNATDSHKRGNVRAGQFRTRRSALRVFTVTPDFVFRKQRLAVFVDGCFWHGCPKHATKPKQNAAFWRKKLAGNRARDRRVNRALRQAGWHVVRVWECELAKCRKHSTPHPGPLPGRGGEGVRVRNAERGMPAVVRRIQRALDANCAN